MCRGVEHRDDEDENEVHAGSPRISLERRDYPPGRERGVRKPNLLRRQIRPCTQLVRYAGNLRGRISGARTTLSFRKPRPSNRAILTKPLAGIRTISFARPSPCKRSSRATHPLPPALPDPPASWLTPYGEMARASELAWTTLEQLAVGAAHPRRGSKSPCGRSSEKPKTFSLRASGQAFASLRGTACLPVLMHLHPAHAARGP